MKHSVYDETDEKNSYTTIVKDIYLFVASFFRRVKNEITEVDNNSNKHNKIIKKLL